MILASNRDLEYERKELVSSDKIASTVAIPSFPMEAGGRRATGESGKSAR
jgi:hypothetical protein